MNQFDQVERWRLRAAEWLDAQQAADLLRECKNDTFAQITSEMEGHSNAEKERNARCSGRWNEYRNKMIEAESQARRLKLRVTYERMMFDAMRSENANARTERNAG